MREYLLESLYKVLSRSDANGGFFKKRSHQQQQQQRQQQQG